MIQVKILAASILCFAFWQAPAQTDVFSLNVVGYYNVPLSPGWNLMAVQLAQTNYNANIILNGQAVDGSLLYRFNPSSQSYYDAGTYLTNVGWYPLSGNTNDSTLNLPLGEGFFIWTPQNWTATIVGEVIQGTLINPLPANYSIKASIVPQAGKLQTDLYFLPEVGDEVSRWISPAFTDYDYVPGFWDPDEPSLNVGEGFFLWSPDPGPRIWTRNFIVQVAPSPPAETKAVLAGKASPSFTGQPFLVARLSVQGTNAVLNVNNAPGSAYDVQFSQDQRIWKTVAAGQTATLWKEPLRQGARGFYRLVLAL